MRIDTSAQNRKAVVKVISELTGEASRYMGPPTFAYQIGEFMVDRDGFIETENDEEGTEVLKGLIEKELVEIEREVEMLEVNVSTGGMNEQNLVNLVFLIHSKQYLINRSFAKEVFQIPKGMIKILEDTAMENRDAFFEIFHQHEEDCKGITFSKERAIFAFPYENNSDTLRVFTELMAMMVKQAREQKRISYTETIVENEKYYMRVWLLRLGFGGTGGKETRRALLKNLKGHSAFRTFEEAERAKERNKQRALERRCSEE